MDAGRFDQIARVLSASGGRRGLLHLLAALPLAGGLPFLAAGDADADGRRRRRKKRHKHGRPRRHGKRKKNKKTRCTPRSRAQTCAGRCGSVKNNCQKTVNCGSCACDPPCEVCKICNEVTGLCEPDPMQLGDDCGEPGQVCQDAGSCACDASSCDAAQCLTCGPDKTCVPAMDNTACGALAVCCNGACTSTETEANCGSCGNTCDVGGSTCLSGACCQSLVGAGRTCSDELPCCVGMCRDSGPLSGACCGPPGFITCFTDNPNSCCSNTCIAHDPSCTGRCPGVCA